MNTTEQQTLFAFDCGATNWRLYRAQYELAGYRAQLIGDPSPSPLTSFYDRRLPAVLMLSPDGSGLESYGEMAQNQVDDESCRLRIRDYFKPCIGAHLELTPQPHQLKYTHKQAMEYTRLMLEAVLAQLLREKWRSGSFDERMLFTFAFPVHWQTTNAGVIFDDFSTMVKSCFPAEMHGNIRFVSEPEGAILSLQRQGHLRMPIPGKTTLIIDMGGSTTDLVAGDVDPGTGELIFIGRYGQAFGGGHYDISIARSLADELLIPASALSEDPSAMLSLRNVAKRLKESLSRQLLFKEDTAQIPQRTVTLVMRDGEIYRSVVKLDKKRFTDITKRLSMQFEGLIEDGLKEIGLNDSRIGQVVLVGGGGQLFSVYHALEERFAGIDLVLADNPDECVVLGCALEYGAEAEKARPSLLFMPDSVLVPEEPESAPEEEKAEPRLMLEADNGDVIILLPGENSVGRANGNKVQIVSEKISRFHAKLHVEGSTLTVTDMGSTNGTFVNGARLSKGEAQPLQSGDQIQFGNRKFVLKIF